MYLPLKVFIGFDRRQPLAYTVARSSVERHATTRWTGGPPVEIHPLRLDWLPITRRGLTEFTFSRYLVPWLCGFQGPALFMDADTIAQADVTELYSVVDPAMAVSVVKTKERFEWPSVMFFQCDNARCQILTPDWVNNETNHPQLLEWAGDRLGELPAEWNCCILYDEPNPQAKIIHYTAGVPCWPQTERSPMADRWLLELRGATNTVSWEHLMGQSVHRKVVEQMNAVADSWASVPTDRLSEV